MNLLTAPWVVPVLGPPIERGAVLVEGGTILAVGPLSDLGRAVPASAVAEFEDCALLPALINAHAHLELTGLARPPSGCDFIGWLKFVIRTKLSATPGDFALATGLGVARCLASGQGAVADVVSTPAASGHPSAGLTRLRLAEVIAASDAAAQVRVEGAAALLESGSDPSGGLFPHAPYTVGSRGYEISARLSLAKWGRFFTHLAESGEEVEFCMTGSGPVAEELYRDLPVAPPRHPGLHPVNHLERLGLLGPGAVLVHAVKVAPPHVAAIASSGASVVLCPRSNRGLKVGDAPGRALLDAGVAVGLGTDSELSAGDLDMTKEVAAAVDAYGFSPMEALTAATLGSARVLGLAPCRGALCAGSRADILALRLGEGSELGGRLAAPAGVSALYLGGERII